ncbi:2-succinyl-5-enolpyruvyl-6-hydroxy-3-cyclohexene-1-carboxylate synthase [Corynebacterium ciconiae DSM 44920]|uniref:2-succinyl-5-enolpyruvyl-6-hydroxy-3- cyclohexene-1-carboxylic-acid synthase n=1 Tax=Corynebacterium ciconiae TaxID=227319 RepID=UPI0012E9F03E|nr:2-succinyl-5-enolpyruvyl-6-hydroxy-3-cyclohexene-1-carboxylic-acid synthase [Corynebacterium ciconiae]WKD60272.1 2-succinyl-5-enolpyruvyl-6-hydroxy-3-cyclohexene-1-carboxylate synthase [Corynebacterium ciconiae DSM 44920]
MTSWDTARAIVEELASSCSDVVVCPGSRNAPLSMALAAAEGLRLHVRLDERDAAFTALGMARVTGTVVPVVMTSGTAVANCLPAMIEAHHADIPLAIVSADRPVRLVGTGASQTITQQGLFSTVTPTVSIAEASRPETARATLRRALAEHRQAHINVAFDTPLVPEVPLEPVAVGQKVASISPKPRDWGEVAVDLSAQVLVIAGDGAWTVEGLEDVPTIAEPSAPAPFHPVHPLAANVLLSGVDIARPEHIIIVGHPTLHRDVLALMRLGVRTTVLTRGDSYTDPWGTATEVASSVRVSGELNHTWLELIDAASTRAADAVRDTLAEDDLGFTGLHAAATVADTLEVGDGFFVGASNPVRDASLVGLPFDGVDTYSPRGTAGIDGSIAQAVGVAVARQHQQADAVRAPRTVALLGDVTFLHDIGGLLLPAGSPRPENLTIVVANDNGGGIFETLEQGASAHREIFDTAFGTPHNADLEGLCVGYGVAHRRVETLPELIDALAESCDYGVDGIEVIEARTTRATRRELHQRLNEKVAWEK